MRKILALIFIIFSTYLIYMSIETWGLMPKSQIDNETIEEAIIRLIAVHEHSPDSHLGENESIEAHRKSEIIDHLAGSVLPDKKDMNDYNIDITFQSLDGLGHDAGASVDAFKLLLYVENGFNTYSFVSNTPFLETAFSQNSYSFLIQFLAYFNQGSVSTAFTEFGRLGFDIQHTRIRGYYWVDGMSSKQYTSWYNVDMHELHSFRAQYFKNEEISRFYIDGVLVGEINYPYTPDNADMYYESRHITNAESDAYFFVTSLKLSLFEK